MKLESPHLGRYCGGCDYHHANYCWWDADTGRKKHDSPACYHFAKGTPEEERKARYNATFKEEMRRHEEKVKEVRKATDERIKRELEEAKR